MEVINVNLPQHPYPVYLGRNIFEQFAEVLEKHFHIRQIALITNETIDLLYGAKLRAAFSSDCYILTLHVPDGEKAKSFEQVQFLYTKLLENKFERNAVIVALGGGVIGDLAGFVAATYLRGVPFVQVPTTLLAQVDSSIGGKVGVNHPLGKNLIGAFKQPLFVFSDISVLKTLPDEEIRCGLGEVIKYGFILNSDFFEFLEKNLEKALAKDEETLLYLVKISAAEKARIVEQDEKEHNLRMILNFGHTFGHALEAVFSFSGLKHGEAVMLGMKCALAYSAQRGCLSAEEFQRGIGILNRVPISYDKRWLNMDRLTDQMRLDKKIKDKKIRLILINRIGGYEIESSADWDGIRKAWEILFID